MNDVARAVVWVFMALAKKVLNLIWETMLEWVAKNKAGLTCRQEKLIFLSASKKWKLVSLSVTSCSVLNAMQRSSHQNWEAGAWSLDKPIMIMRMSFASAQSKIQIEKLEGLRMSYLASVVSVVKG